MAAPLPYNITVDFSEEESDQTSGRSTVRTAALDQELANVVLAINSAISRSTAIQRDDNQLLDGIVHAWALGSDVLAIIGSAGWNLIGFWLTATAYAAKDVVISGTGTYVCVVAHTSGVFATDRAAGKWTILYDSANFTAASMTFTPTGSVSATNVQSAIAEVASEAPLKANALSDIDAATARINLSTPSWFDIQQENYTLAALGGSADAITGDFIVPRPSLINDFGLIAVAFAANVTSTPTWNQDGLGPKVIKKYNLQPLEQGDISGAGHVIRLHWSATNDCYLLENAVSTGLNSRERVAVRLALSQLAR